MTKRLFPLIALIWVSALPAQNHDYAALFEDAIKNIDWEFEDEWAYTETTLTDGELRIGRFDPRLEEDSRWSLISIDGREPTARERRKFAHDKEDHDSSDSRTTSIVGADSLELLEETDEYWLFSFVPDEDEQSFLESVDAKVKIVKAGPYVESINIRNHSVIKPGFGTKLSEFVMLLEFGPAIDNGPVVPRSVKVHVSGRALLFIGINETEVVTNGDFEYAGD